MCHRNTIDFFGLGILQGGSPNLVGPINLFKEYLQFWCTNFNSEGWHEICIVKQITHQVSELKLEYHSQDKLNSWRFPESPKTLFYRLDLVLQHHKPYKNYPKWLDIFNLILHWLSN